MNLHQPANDGFVPRLCVFYGGLGAAIGVQMPFMPVWLAAKGLDPVAIGIVLAAPMVLRLVALPTATRAADRRAALREAIILAAGTAALGYALVGFAESFWPILLLVAFASAVFSVTFPLTDAYALKGLSVLKRAYGPVRLWASASFIVGNVGAGYALDRIPGRDLIWIMAAVFVGAALTALALKPLHEGPMAPAAPRHAAIAVLRSPSFLAVAAAASLIQASHAVYYGFSTLAWSAAGLNGLSIGALWAVGVAAEIVLFAFSGRLPPAIRPTTLLALGGIGAVIRWGIMALDPPTLALPLLQCLHALSFGATHLGSVQFLSQAAPDHLAATAQGYLSLAIGVAMAAAMAISGVLFEAYGSGAYTAMAATGLVGALCAFAAHRLQKPQPHKSGAGG